MSDDYSLCQISSAYVCVVYVDYLCQILTSYVEHNKSKKELKLFWFFDTKNSMIFVTTYVW